MQSEEQIKALQKQQLKRARNTALVLGSALIVCLIFLMTAFVHKEKAAKLESELVSTKQDLETCRNSK